MRNIKYMRKSDVDCKGCVGHRSTH